MPLLASRVWIFCVNALRGVNYAGLDLFEVVRLLADVCDLLDPDVPSLQAMTTRNIRSLALAAYFPLLRFRNAEPANRFTVRGFTPNCRDAFVSDTPSALIFEIALATPIKVSRRLSASRRTVRRFEVGQTFLPMEKTGASGPLSVECAWSDVSYRFLLLVGSQK